MKKLYNIAILFFTLLLSLSCTRQKQSDDVDGIDNINNKNNKENKFVSLSPSITKQIIDLSYEDSLLGITSFCPPVKNADIVGTLVNPSVEEIVLLNPKMVLMSLEDRAVQKTDVLKKSGIKIHFFPRNKNFADISKNYIELAKIMNSENTAIDKLKQYTQDFESLKSTGSQTAVFMVSVSPLIAASGKSFIGDILRNSGYKNEFENLKVPYPVISIESLLSKNPEFIFVMDKLAYNYLKKHSALSKLPSKIYYVGTENSPYYTLSDYIKTLKTLTGFRTKE